MKCIDSRLSMGTRKEQLAVGLAMICELYNRRLNMELSRLYLSPDSESIAALHGRLIKSDDYRDREVGLWLGLVVETQDPKLDFKDLEKELQEMEFILTSLMGRVSEASQREVNDWINYLANAAYGIRDGFWLDAKIDMNRALHSSRKEAVERIKEYPQLAYEIGLLQDETSRIFEQIVGLPIGLNIPEENLNLALSVQGILLELMREMYLERASESNETLKYLCDRFSSALRHSMRADMKAEEVQKEVELAESFLEAKAQDASAVRDMDWIKEMQKKTKALSMQINR